jgi:signal recognition particle subunit SRP54
MLVGLHGCGKTTTALNSQDILGAKKRPYLVPADVYRPAAIDQLQKLGEELKVDFTSEASQTPLEICKKRDSP